MNEKTKSKILLGIYLLLLVWIILFKLSYRFSDLITPRSINLIPFYYPHETSFHLSEVIDNILIFIPLGILLKMLNTSNTKTILLGLSFSFFLETLQFILSIGASDITDIITNTTGTLFGLTFYLILNKIFKDKIKINKILNGIGTIVAVLFISLIILLIISNQ